MQYMICSNVVATADTNGQNSQPKVYRVGSGAAISERYGLALDYCEY
jgi:hypothetical protein